jgi:hypothetical protein
VRAWSERTFLSFACSRRIIVRFLGWQLLRQYDELGKDAAAGIGGQGANKRREQGAELLLKHREQLEATDDSDALWRLSSACWVLAMKAQGSRKELDDSTRAMLHDGLKLAQRAAERGVWQAHKWAAVCVSVLGKHPESINDKLLKGKLFYDHLNAAIELKPDDDVSAAPTCLLASLCARPCRCCLC